MAPCHTTSNAGLIQICRNVLRILPLSYSFSLSLSQANQSLHWSLGLFLLVVNMHIVHGIFSWHPSSSAMRRRMRRGDGEEEEEEERKRRNLDRTGSNREGVASFQGLFVFAKVLQFRLPPPPNRWGKLLLKGHPTRNPQCFHKITVPFVETSQSPQQMECSQCLS